MRIAVIGVGKLGSVMCGCLADPGHHVCAADPEKHKVDPINRGISPVLEPELDRLIAGARAASRLHATQEVRTAIAGTDLSFICVGTPPAEDGSARSTQVEQAVGAIGDALRDGGRNHTIVMCSTVPPGTAERLCIPLLEARSGRRHGRACATSPIRNSCAKAPRCAISPGPP
jgi:GDP-mannose 6-dehydrogenase